MAELTQLHHQLVNPPYTTDFVAQREVGSKEGVKEFLREMSTRHPLPKGARWMICKEDSEYFIRSGA